VPKNAKTLKLLGDKYTPVVSFWAEPKFSAAGYSRDNEIPDTNLMLRKNTDILKT
jgi:hypothetical protein